MFEDEADELSYLEAAADTIDAEDDVSRPYASFDLLLDDVEDADDEEDDEDTERYK